MKDAPAKADEVCPEGNDLWSVPSGRFLRVISFNKYVVEIVDIYDFMKLVNP